MASRIVRIAEASEAALLLASRSIASAAPSPLLEPAGPVDPVAVAREVLAPYLERTDRRSGWVVLDEEGLARALLGTSLEIVGEDHPGYTYLPERYATAPLTSWHIASAADAETWLPQLVEHVAADARPLGIRRLSVAVRPHDWLGGAAWRALGLQPDVILAGRRAMPTLDPGSLDITIRPARSGDEDALVGLAFEEYEYHAAHTRGGTRSGQALAPTERIVRAWIDRAEHEGALVALDPRDGRMLGCLATDEIELPPVTAARTYLPERYGYIGLTSVTDRARGRGVGRALAARALADFAALGLEHVLLHYADDNALSRPFWNRMGFSPILGSLTGEILGGHSGRHQR